MNRMTQFSAWATVGLISAAALAGCSSQPRADKADKVVRTTADYPTYDTGAELVGNAAVIVRGAAVSSRVEWLYPEVSTNSDPAVNPQAGLPSDEVDAWQQDSGVVVTISTVRVDEVLKGDIQVGQQIEVSQLGGTIDDVTYEDTNTVVLPADGSDYALLLADHNAKPFDLLNPQQALYKAEGTGDDAVTLQQVGTEEVAPLNGQSVTTVKALVKTATHTTG
jgi:hypothetical protein